MSDDIVEIASGGASAQPKKKSKKKLIILLAALVVLVAAQGLLRATTTAIGQAAGFLRSTPLPATRLAWPLLPRPLLAQGGLAASLALLIAPQRPLAARRQMARRGWLSQNRVHR